MDRKIAILLCFVLLMVNEISNVQARKSHDETRFQPPGSWNNIAVAKMLDANEELQSII
uniref:Uncharacterized protein n=1 Tax=Ciona savignyi TaxID=51511 RepID=H2YIV0_CIOSA